MKYIMIIIGKIILFCGKLLHRGSSLPGKIILRFYPHFMKKIKLPDKIIAVTGSSGKGSISSTVAEVYRKLGYRVAHNVAGSNLTYGIATLLLQYCSIFGKLKCDVLVFEIDERYAKYVFPDIKPTHVLISNISRDQPPRQGHFDFVYEEIKSALSKEMHLILNADDPMLQIFNLENEFQVTYYSMDQNQYSYPKSKFKNLNITHCPVCHHKLIYDYYHFETLGHYHCSHCKFQTPKAKYHITNLNFDTPTMTINEKYVIQLPYDMLYCAYNTLAAFTIVATTEKEEEKIATYLNALNVKQKNHLHTTFQNRNVYILNNKNENATTFNQSILFTDRHDGKKTLVIGWKEISRRYQFDDLSWLYDVDFELFARHDIDTVICIGLHRYDIATRMKYAGIDEKKIKTFESLEGVTACLEKTKGDIFAILNFDLVLPFQESLKEGDSK